MEKRQLTRAEVPVHLTWKLEDLFATEQAWEEGLASIKRDLPALARFKGKLGEGAAALTACLDEREALYVRASRVSAYARLSQLADGANPVHQANFSRAGDLVSEVNAAVSFVDSELLALPEGTVERYLDEEPALQPLRKSLLELLETKRHALSPETEQALASLGELFQSPSVLYRRVKASDMRFEPIEDGRGGQLPLTFASYENYYESSPDTSIRRKANESFVKTLDRYKNTFAQTYATEVKKQVTMARLRRYESVTHMLLDSHQISLDMYHNQHDILLRELAPHMRRLAGLKRQQMGLERMRFCDLKVSSLDPGFKPEMSYEEASRTIIEALRVMGPEYGQIMQEALTNRWADLAENEGKSTGASCTTPYGAHSYIIMTWTNTMRNAFTLAHELGHAGHFMLAGRHQRMTNTRPSMYVIEAPSTLNELLLAEHIMAGTDDDRMKRWVVGQLLGTYYHNFVTHLLEGELQRRIYAHAEAGKPITASVLCEQKAELLSAFWGDAVEIDYGAALTWMRQPHYYMGLYPYTYSAGLTASTAMAKRIREEGEPAVDRWLNMLKAGGTKRPLELLLDAGVDMSKPEPIREAAAYVGSLVDLLERE